MNELSQQFPFFALSLLGFHIKVTDFPGGSDVKESTCNADRPEFNPWVRTIPWQRKWQPTPVFWPGESYGQRSLAGYSPWGCKESDMTQQLIH